MSIFLENRRVFLTPEARKPAEVAAASPKDAPDSLPQIGEKVIAAQESCRLWEGKLKECGVSVPTVSKAANNRTENMLAAFQKNPKDLPILAAILAKHNSSITTV